MRALVICYLLILAVTALLLWPWVAQLRDVAQALA